MLYQKANLLERCRVKKNLVTNQHRRSLPVMILGYLGIPVEFVAKRTNTAGCLAVPEFETTCFISKYIYIYNYIVK